MKELKRLESEIASFEAAARRHALRFAGLLLLAGLLGYSWNLWAALVPGAVALLAVALCFSCLLRAGRLRRTHAFWKAAFLSCADAAANPLSIPSSLPAS